MAVLFGKARTTITEHKKNVFKEGELNEEVACRNFRFCVLGCQYHITLYAPTQRTMNEISLTQLFVRIQHFSLYKSLHIFWVSVTDNSPNTS